MESQHVLSKALRVAHHLPAHVALYLCGEVALNDVSAPVVPAAEDLLAQLAADFAPSKRHQEGVEVDVCKSAKCKALLLGLLDWITD